MLVFGHAGITLGAAVLLSSVLGSSRLSKNLRNQATDSSPRLSQAVPRRKAWRFSYLGSYVDIRLLMAGSLLPDIIDKPVGRFLFGETFSSGRIFSHTLLFLILVTAIGIYLYRRYNKTWFLALSFGTLTHLILDQIWRSPRTLFWPLLGLAFERADLTAWIHNMLYGLLTSPAVYISELTGVAIIIWFTIELAQNRKVSAFVKYGQVQ